MEINLFSCRGGKEAAGGAEKAFTRGTTQNLVPQWRSFLLFCVYFQFNPALGTIECGCLFAEFLSHSFMAVTSIQNYIGGECTLHGLLNVPFPGTDNIELRLTLPGLKWLKHHVNRQAAPLSSHILCRVHGLLDLSAPFDAILLALYWPCSSFPESHIWWSRAKKHMIRTINYATQMDWLLKSAYWCNLSGAGHMSVSGPCFSHSRFSFVPPRVHIVTCFGWYLPSWMSQPLFCH